MTLEIGPLVIETERACVWWSGRRVDLRPMEYRLLLYLARHHDRALTRDELRREVWAATLDDGTRTVDVHITRLRRALPEMSEALVTVRRIGYRLDRGRLEFRDRRARR